MTDGGSERKGRALNAALTGGNEDFTARRL
jgi:hypothetical protein